MIITSCDKNKQVNIEISDLALITQEDFSVKQWIANIEQVEPAKGFEDMFYEDNLKSNIDIMVSQIVAKLSNRSDLRVVDRTKINEIQAEHSFQTSDWSSDVKTTEIGVAANANMLIHLTAHSANEIAVQFMNLNTMQTISILINDSNIAELSTMSFEKLSDKEQSNSFTTGLYYFNGITKSQHLYTEDNLNLITPFGKYRPANVDSQEVSQLLPRKMRNIKTFDIDENSLVTIITEDDETIYATAVVNLDDAESYFVNDNEYSTLSIGDIRIREDDGPKLLEGTVFYSNEFMSIHFASENGDGTGFAYFINFEK